MPLYNKTLDAITEADLNELVASEEGEARIIEYKEKLTNFKIAQPGHDVAVMEFLADVSSFANASGGDLLYGVRAVKGIPTEITGTGKPHSEVDGIKGQLSQLIEGHVRPRLAFDIQPVLLEDESKGAVFIIRIRRGFSPPHQIAIGQDYRFYSRNSAGKYRLDIDELRTIIDLSGTLARRIRDFRAERLASILAGETPVALGGEQKTVLHIVPLDAFGLAEPLNLAQLSDPSVAQNLRQLDKSSSNSQRWNLDGLLMFGQPFGGFAMVPVATQSAGPQATGYVQLFRNGIVEVVDGLLIPAPMDGLPGNGYIPADRWEHDLIDGTSRYLGALHSLGVRPPIVLMLSILGVRNFVLYSMRLDGNPDDRRHHIDRNDLIIPEVLIDDETVDVGKALRPIFDAVWNAAGHPRCFNYSEEGERRRLLLS